MNFLSDFFSVLSNVSDEGTLLIAIYIAYLAGNFKDQLCNHIPTQIRKLEEKQNIQIKELKENQKEIRNNINDIKEQIPKQIKELEERQNIQIEELKENQKEIKNDIKEQNQKIDQNFKELIRLISK